MDNGIAKELAEKLLKSEEQVERVEEDFKNAPKTKKELEIIPNTEQDLLETMKEETWGISLPHRIKFKKIETLEVKIRMIKRIISMIESILKETDVNKYNPSVATDLQEIEQEFTIENQQLIWAKKNINKKIESWEDIVTIQDLKELESMIKHTKQKLGKIMDEVEKYKNL